jgi:hypothetical protein
MTTLLVGSAWILGTFPALFAPAAFFFLMGTVFIPFEEQRMFEIFRPAVQGLPAPGEALAIASTKTQRKCGAMECLACSDLLEPRSWTVPE